MTRVKADRDSSNHGNESPRTNELPTPDAIRALFDEKGRHQSWLDAEAALAMAEAELGMIPKAAADDIAAHAFLDRIDEAAFYALAARNHAPILALVETLARACSEASRPFVHWGGTTQNIIQSARLVQVRSAHDALLARLGRILAALAELAERGANMLCARRSNRRQGLPITFGLKVAAWIDEILRHEARLRGAEDRVFVPQFGGALGAMHAFGDDGPALNVAVSKRLGLAPVDVPSRAALDHLAEYMQLLALLGASCAKIANELYTLMTDEIGEVIERVEGAVGSSTMPQKINSKLGVRVIADATRLRGYAVSTLEAMQPSREGDAASNLVMYSALDEGVPLAYGLVCAFETLLNNIELRPAQTRANVDASQGLILFEKAMMLFVPYLGRVEAHRVIHESGARRVAPYRTDGASRTPGDHRRPNTGRRARSGRLHGP